MVQLSDDREKFSNERVLLGDLGTPANIMTFDALLLTFQKFVGVNKKLMEWSRRDWEVFAENGDSINKLTLCRVNNKPFRFRNVSIQ